MKQQHSFVISQFTNPSGEIVFRVSGWLDGKRLRKNFPTRSEAEAERQALEVQRLQGETSVRPTVTRLDARTFSLLRTIRYDGIYDGLAEGLGNLRKVMERVMAKEHYVSPTFVQHLKKPKSNKRDVLTEQEQMILSVIGDGTDNLEAGEKLALSKHTIHSHRKSIMGKLRLHHRGELIIYALQQGYVQVSPNGVYRPGFQRKIRENNGEAKSGGDPVFV